jgi:hypothetical protein
MLFANGRAQRLKPPLLYVVAAISVMRSRTRWPTMALRSTFCFGVVVFKKMRNNKGKKGRDHKLIEASHRANRSVVCQPNQAENG